MTFDLIVVGGGASGMIAAGHAAEAGLKVLILEKMARCARKLRITGKGRCNITNTATLNEFFNHIAPNPKFLYPAFKTFFSKELITFMENTLKVPVKEERGGRVFPVSDNAQDVVDAFYNWNHVNGVMIKTNTIVRDLLFKDSALAGVIDIENREYYAPAVIMAVGGKSYPLTGSTGDGYPILQRYGHTINPLHPGLVPLVTKEKDVIDLMGVSLKNVSASIYVNGKKKYSEFGEMLFTHFGLSGPIILTLSRIINTFLMPNNTVEISIDFKPALDDETMKARLIREMELNNRKHFEAVLKTLFPGKVVSYCAKRIGVPLDKSVSHITAEERKNLHRFCKDLRFNISGTRPIEEAIVTAGGVDLKEVQQA
ncbi:MAG: NAD(P)/FAD-dependent oxidoreductase, partial [Candidatus Cloacimonetes bacterium]|nr:NAD(P)/FAD-dependent oxidoreductase [Candidatus Cloacimonadota bacterium]